ncbi:MAG TPA: hypothetical protein VK308_11300 [Pyrinomonadaceae bacterium]|nr:hypothetical protein [Pyrinomonadaceae bacterium]
MKGKETEEVYRHKLMILGKLENLPENHLIDWYYADESRVSLVPGVPYDWQFADEECFDANHERRRIELFRAFEQKQSMLD